MRSSSRRAVASISIALLMCGLSGTAMSQTGTPSGRTASSLPSVTVEAPKQVARPPKPEQHAVTRSGVSGRTSPTTATLPASPAERELAKLPNAITGSCVDGCVTSFRSGDRPWVGCSWSSGTLSGTCRNVGNYKTYNECATAGLAIGWRSNEVVWYCSSLALR